MKRVTKKPKSVQLSAAEKAKRRMENKERAKREAEDKRRWYAERQARLSPKPAP